MKKNKCQKTVGSKRSASIVPDKWIWTITSNGEHGSFTLDAADDCGRLTGKMGIYELTGVWNSKRKAVILFMWHGDRRFMRVYSGDYTEVVENGVKKAKLKGMYRSLEKSVKPTELPIEFEFPWEAQTNILGQFA